ncbi:DUF2063 domain-containing protein [Yoonia sp.]|uniref:HvfC/BufC N-terminal domain-containing protein n=1 Tax=Yoonia sp. TaxID=2212373 RepID=UPI0019FCCDFD|nr:DNA-binding domain-containing protein [Yoonia sp.]MBE0413268.1 putative DNA-binding domain-containing protein [Yoonia sp.]
MTATQASFIASVLDPQAAVPQGLQNPDGAPATKRFDVYRNNVSVSLADALETAFPVVRKLVGDAFFRAMAGVYLRQHPPKTPLMMFYGDAMPAFLGRFTPARSLPYLSDIAAVELAMRHAYHAADVPPMDAETLATLAPDALLQTRLRFAPATQVIPSDYPIYSIYRANTVADAPKPVMQPETVLITRPDLDPMIDPINTATARCITALLKGQTLGQAMTGVGDDLDMGGTLGLLLRQSAVTAIY